MYNLASKNFIITGSEGQIGKGIVNELKRYNVNILKIDIKNKKNKNYYCVDISNEKEVIDLFKSISKKKNLILINNAGIGTYTSFESRTKEELNKVLNLNLIGTVNMIKQFYLYIKKNQIRNSRIINIASLYGHIIPNFDIYKEDNRRFSSEIYGTSKAGVPPTCNGVGMPCSAASRKKTKRT